MENTDQQRRTGGRDKSAVPVFIRPPTPHEGIERALHRSFDPSAALPDDLNRLLGRLR